MLFALGPNVTTHMSLHHRASWSRTCSIIEKAGVCRSAAGKFPNTDDIIRETHAVNNCRAGFPLVSNQPVTVLSYGSDIVACNSQFNGTILSQTNCTSNAQTLRKGDVLSTTSLTQIIAIILPSIFLLL
jgi:hypothetical protein